MIDGDRKCAPAKENNRESTWYLPVVVSLVASRLTVPSAVHPGQGAHREVGSEGFEAKHRAVAEQGEPVGQSPGETEPALRRRRKYLECWAHQGVCGRHGAKGTCVTPGGLVRSCARRGRVPGRISDNAKSPGMPCEKSEWSAVP